MEHYWRIRLSGGDCHHLFRTGGRNCPVKSSRHNGIASALGAALLFGASTPLAKLAVSTASPVLIAGLLYLGSGVGLGVLRMIQTASRRSAGRDPSRGKRPAVAGRGHPRRRCGRAGSFAAWLCSKPQPARPPYCSISKLSRLPLLHGSSSGKTWTNALAPDSLLSSWEASCFRFPTKDSPSQADRC